MYTVTKPARWAATGVLVSLACAGCAGTVDEDASIKALQAAPPCCGSLANLHYEELPASKDVSFSIQVGDGPFDFGTDGKSYYRAFRLPASSDDYAIFLSAQYMVENAAVSFHSYFFYPVMTLLDASMHALAETSVDDLRLRKGEFGANDYLQVAFTVKPSMGARYLVVHTPEDNLGKAKTFSYTIGPEVYVVGNISTVTPPGTQLVEYPGVPVALGNSLEIALQPVQSESSR